MKLFWYEKLAITAVVAGVAMVGVAFLSLREIITVPDEDMKRLSTGLVLAAAVLTVVSAVLTGPAGFRAVAFGAFAINLVSLTFLLLGVGVKWYLADKSDPLLILTLHLLPQMLLCASSLTLTLLFFHIKQERQRIADLL